jgi:hypothetical protein
MFFGRVLQKISSNTVKAFFFERFTISSASDCDRAKAPGDVCVATGTDGGGRARASASATSIVGGRARASASATSIGGGRARASASGTSIGGGRARAIGDGGVARAIGGDRARETCPCRVGAGFAIACAYMAI